MKLFKKDRPAPLLVQAGLGCIFSAAVLLYWILSVQNGDYFIFPSVFQAFLIIDVFFLFPIYSFSCSGILLGKKDFEVSAMMSGLGIFSSRAAFLIGSIIDSFTSTTPFTFFIFMIVPLQAWIFTLYLGWRLEILEWRITGKRWWQAQHKKK